MPELLSVSDQISPKTLALLNTIVESPESIGNDVSSTLARLDAFRELISKKQLPTMAPLLPLLFNLQGKPYTLRDHFPFEAFYQTSMTREIVFKTARQVSKSTNIAAKSILLCNAVPDFAILSLTPQYEQIRRFSTQYVRPFIENSPVKSHWVGTSTENSVLMRTFKNRSRMFFSFAMLSCDRVRGIAASAVSIDEIQDMDASFIPIIKETMGGPASWRIFMATGTPKTLDNTIHGQWSSSSQAEWCILCPRCKKLNVPAMGYDLEKMIGPFSVDIGPNRPGVICAKCSLPIDPRTGRWVHKYEHLRWKFPGYHIPQIIMPMHYGDKERWSDILAKQRGYGNYTAAQFYNEVLGESYDVGTKLVNETDLRNAACLPWRNSPDNVMEIIPRLRGYELLILAVDWGGGGQEQTSFTTCAVMGWQPNGKIDVIYGKRLLTPHDHIREAKEILHIFNQFGCHLMCHDYTGAGSLRETLIVQAGLPAERTVPISYVAAARQNIMVFREATEFHPRNYYQVDKTRSLVLTCACIKMGYLRFFQFDYVSNDDPGLMYDFLALVENKIPTRAGSDLYTITRSSMMPDDFAQAVNIGCCTIWYRTQQWPNLAELARLQVTVEQMRHISPDTPDWEGEYLTGGMNIIP